MKQLDLSHCPDIEAMLKTAPRVRIAHSFNELYELCIPTTEDGQFHVTYSIGEDEVAHEATVCKVRNGIAVNYTDPYMRRRDADCMYIGDELPTDKERFVDNFGQDFKQIRGETLEWLAGQDLLVLLFPAGQMGDSLVGMAIVPDNAAFFAYGLALLQNVLDPDTLTSKTKPRCILLVAPPFRHTHFEEKQVVVHCRQPESYEIFSYNLYPGPSAKKGVYGALLHMGEQEGWLTTHSSAVQLITPYGNRLAIMHEGASGGGKSEMNEHIHREEDGTIFVGTNIVTQETKHMVIPRGCKLKPVADDMAICHPTLQKDNGKLAIQDAEYGWFIRVDHILKYGTDPDMESLSINPVEPLLFINIDAQPGSTALLWEHIHDSQDQPCPNPRFILPRSIVPGVKKGPVSIDIRSFGVRTPPCTQDNPSYGILGLFHILPPALAWIWRLVSPRGYANPSIIDTGKMESEGVGSFWPFASGKRITYANLLLQQIVQTPNVRYILCPVKHVGAWNVGFSPQWITREYLARRGGVQFFPDEVSAARSPLLGYALEKLVMEGHPINHGLLQVHKQPEVGNEAYDKGSQQLMDFFKQELKVYYNDPEIDPLGKKILDLFYGDQLSVANLEKILEGASIFIEE